jgi:hypothetical protein
MVEHDVKVKDVIGPFPADNSGMIMLAANGRMFPVRCSFLDGQIMTAKASGEQFPLEFMYDALSAAGVRIDHVQFCAVDDMLYCRVMVAKHGSPDLVRIPAQSAAMAVEAAVSASAPMRIGDGLLSEMVDATTPYGALKSHFKTLWPLPSMTDNASLMALSNFMDEVMPNGSVFSR